MQYEAAGLKLPCRPPGEWLVVCKTNNRGAIIDQSIYDTIELLAYSASFARACQGIFAIFRYNVFLILHKVATDL
jgi:hypothetical protein